MIEQRGSHAAAAVGGKLYAFSGGGVVSNVGTCECMEPSSHEWHYVGGMQTKRHALSAVATQDSIYAVGGWEDGRYARTSHSYTLTLNPEPHHGRVEVDAVIYDRLSSRLNQTPNTNPIILTPPHILTSHPSTPTFLVGARRL
jgi:hypothetical protein